MRSGTTRLDPYSRLPIRATLALAIMACLPALPALAQSAQAVTAGATFDIPAGDLAGALDRLSTQAGVQLMYQPGLVAGKQAKALSGHLTWQAALQQLLQGSGLEYRQVNATTIVIRQSEQAAKPGARPTAAPPSKPTEGEETPVTDMKAMTVTGTRIRGGTTPSPVVTIGAENIREEGFTDLGEVIRNIPQNFSGGQNPGVSSGATDGGVNNQNITGGSGVNLRGLGQDATLTLLNGRRMSYGGYVQMVDISAIPAEAVERIEIVPDGASAIYGSDAVGGVANVVLKRDFDGVTVGTSYGHAADGGLTTREYTATAGTTWSTGGLIATWKKASTDPIYSSQRDYTKDMYRPSTLWQGSDLSSGLLSVHQSLGDVVGLHLDVLRAKRDILSETSYQTNYYRYAPETTTSLVSPSVDFLLPNDWVLTVSGALGKDKTAYYQDVVISATDVVSSALSGSYSNASRTFEVGGEGPLFVVPGGDARLAVGAGYRYNKFLYLNKSGNSTVADGNESNRFAYAELSLPLIGSDQGIAGVHRLALTGAMRTEDYDSFGRVTTPKVGLIYSPSVDFTLRTSWGKSFKAPTLVQRYYSRNAYLYPTTTFGGTGYESDATVLYLSGGTPDLKPERARTWSASLAFHPEAVPGLEGELTAFDIDYTDRVVQPIIISQALSNPVYAEFVDYDPVVDKQSDIIADSMRFYNYANAAYDPSKVRAIIGNRYVNATRQRLKGIDLSGTYRFDLGAGRLAIRGSASWLDSTQATTSLQSPYDLAGMLFYPVKVSSRVGAVWNQGGFTASFFGNYKSGVKDTIVGRKGASFSTFDTTLRYDTGEGDGMFSDMAFDFAARNLFNRAPPLYAATSLTYAPYDSTNYSAIGRFLSISVSKHW